MNPARSNTLNTIYAGVPCVLVAGVKVQVSIVDMVQGVFMFAKNGKASMLFKHGAGKPMNLERL